MQDNRYLKILRRHNLELCKVAIKTYKQYQEQSFPILSTLSCCIAPVIWLYIDWVIKEAQYKGIQRLYFLARDGFIFHKVAKIICEERQINIDCRYLYCSRMAWRIPTYHIMAEKCIDFICMRSMNISLNTIMERSGITKEEQLYVLQKLDLNLDSLNKSLNQEELCIVKEKLKNCQTFLSLVYKHSKACYKNTIGYLKQEGLMDDISMAIVDTGWTGSMQKTLNQLLNIDFSHKNIEGFYFGIYDLPINSNANKYHSFYFHKKGGFMRKLIFNNNLFEVICCAPTGMTIGYKKNTIYEPIFSEAENLNFNQFDINLHHQIIISFVKNMVKNSDISHLSHLNSICLSKKLLQKLMTLPTFQEAEFYGKFLFSDNISETEVIELAPILSEQELREIDFIPKTRKRFFNRIIDNKSFWLEGSIIRSHSKYAKWHILNAKFWELSIIIYSLLLNFKRRRL